MMQHCHLDGSEGSQAKRPSPFSEKDKEQIKSDVSVYTREPSEGLHSPTRGTLFVYLNINKN